MHTEGPAKMPAQFHAGMLQKDGYALIGSVLPAGLLAALNEEFIARYSHLLQVENIQDGAVKVGVRRHMITVKLSGVFGDPAVYASSAVMDVLAITFDKDFVLDSFGIVLSLPGSETQHRHRDGMYLFNEGVSSILPAHAVTVGIPLVDMNAIQGTTEIFPGSHRIVHWKEGSPSVVPAVPAGSCVMWDFRLAHRGTENRSTQCRPLLYMTYSRPWWRDWRNYRQVWHESGPVRPQERIQFGEDFFRTVPEDARFLFRSVGA